MHFSGVVLFLGVFSNSGIWCRPQSEGYSYPVPDIPFDYLPPDGSEGSEVGRGSANLLPPLPSFTSAQGTVRPAITIKPVVSQAPRFPFTSSKTTITDSTTSTTRDSTGSTRTSSSSKKSSSVTTKTTATTKLATLVNPGPTVPQSISSPKSAVPSGTIEVITSQSSGRPSTRVTRPVQKTRQPTTTRIQSIFSKAGSVTPTYSSTTKSKSEIKNTVSTGFPSVATRIRKVVTVKSRKPASSQTTRKSTRPYTYQTKSTSRRPATSQTTPERKKSSTTRRVTSNSPSTTETKTFSTRRRTQNTTPSKTATTTEKRKTTYIYRSPTTKKQAITKNQRLPASLQSSAPVNAGATTKTTQKQKSRPYSVQQVTTYKPQLTQTASKSTPPTVQVQVSPIGSGTKQTVVKTSSNKADSSKADSSKADSSKADSSKADTKSNKASMMHMSRPYEFGYSVDDSDTSNTFSQKESSDGMVITGEYRWKMPDGRTQIVTYLADWAEGFYPSIRYE